MSFDSPQKASGKGHAAGVRCISYISGDTLAFTNFSPEQLARIEAVINTSWRRGVQSSKSYDDGKHNLYKIKCLGNPWRDHQDSTAGVTDTCRLLLGLARLLVSEGWGVELSMIGKGWGYSGFNHSSWFLTEAKQKATKDPAMCCIAFGNSDMLRIIEGGSEVVEAVQSTITHYWARGLQERKSYGDTEKFKFRGKPWSNAKFEHDMFLSQLMQALRSVGWTVFAIVEFRRSGGEDSMATWTRWILRKH